MIWKNTLKEEWTGKNDFNDNYNYYGEGWSKHWDLNFSILNVPCDIWVGNGITTVDASKNCFALLGDMEEEEAEVNDGGVGRKCATFFVSFSGVK